MKDLSSWNFLESYHVNTQLSLCHDIILVKKKHTEIIYELVDHFSFCCLHIFLTKSVKQN